MAHTNDMLLWQKVFQVAKKLGGPEDMVFVNFITGNRKYKTTEHAENIQNRWDARCQKRKIARDVPSFGVHKDAKKI